MRSPLAPGTRASQPPGGQLALLVAAAGTLIIQEGAKARFGLDRCKSFRDAHVEIGLDRLRRDVHRKVHLDL